MVECWTSFTLHVKNITDEIFIIKQISAVVSPKKALCCMSKASMNQSQTFQQPWIFLIYFLHLLCCHYYLLPSLLFFHLLKSTLFFISKIFLCKTRAKFYIAYTYSIKLYYYLIKPYYINSNSNKFISNWKFVY